MLAAVAAGDEKVFWELLVGLERVGDMRKICYGWVRTGDYVFAGYVGYGPLPAVAAVEDTPAQGGVPPPLLESSVVPFVGCVLVFVDLENTYHREFSAPYYTYPYQFVAAGTQSS